MTKPKTARLFDAFQNTFSEVLSQCSGKPWSAELVDPSNAAELVRVAGSASGSHCGGFAFAFSAQAGILLAQALVMADQPAATYGEEEREATLELLRQVCGRCSTTLADSAGQLDLTIDSESSDSWTPAIQQAFKLSQEDRLAIIQLDISPELLASLNLAESSSAPIVENGTDRVSLQAALSSRNLDLLMDVRLGVRLRFGSRRMKLREVLEFHAGTIVDLDRQVQAPVDLLVDNKVIAHGEVVVINGNYGIKVSDVLSPRQCVEALY